MYTIFGYSLELRINNDNDKSW